MPCEEAKWLDAYFDRELDLATSVTVEAHLSQCPTCRAVLEGHQALRLALSDSKLRYSPPARMRLMPPRPLPLRALLAAAAIVVLVLGIQWMLVRPQSQEMAALHVRSMMASHLTDVASTDQHTVKPWFQGKLDYSPPVYDLASDEYPLQGGRLDSLGDRSIAALVYGHRKHIIDVFVWPESGPDKSVDKSQSRGYNIVGWRLGGWRFWAVSDLNATDLEGFSRLLQQKLSGN
jgi:anti-sigma factor RsiW